MRTDTNRCGLHPFHYLPLPLDTSKCEYRYLYRCGLLSILSGSDRDVCNHRLCSLSFVHHLFLNIMPGKKTQQIRSIVSRRHTLNLKHLNRMTTIYLASSNASDIVSKRQRIKTQMSHNLRRGHANNMIIHL